MLSTARCRPAVSLAHTRVPVANDFRSFHTEPWCFLRVMKRGYRLILAVPGGRRLLAGSPAGCSGGRPRRPAAKAWSRRPGRSGPLSPSATDRLSAEELVMPRSPCDLPTVGRRWTPDLASKLLLLCNATACNSRPGQRNPPRAYPRLCTPLCAHDAHARSDGRAGRAVRTHMAGRDPGRICSDRH